MLIGQFWGTSAAESVPAPFCRCPNCENARRVGGKEIRLTSCFRLTDSIMLDLGADAVVQSMKYGEISMVNHVVITHTHVDHLNSHMMMQSMWAQEKPEYRHRGTLHYYLTDQAFAIIEEWRNTPWVLKGRLREFEEKGYVAFHKWEYGQRYEIEGIGFTPLRGNHRGSIGEHTAMPLIELPDGRTLFYGLDSATYFPETLEALKGRHVDLYISENAVGCLKNAEPHPSHMRLCDVYELAKTLVSQGTLDQSSTLYLTHINHRSGHAENEAAVQEMQFPVKTVVAYDGLKIL